MIRDILLVSLGIIIGAAGVPLWILLSAWVYPSTIKRRVIERGWKHFELVKEIFAKKENETA
jgi:hypothetical protein